MYALTLLLTLLSFDAGAQAPRTSEIESAKQLFVLWVSPGYVQRKDEFTQDCLIDEKGNIDYRYASKTKVKTFKRKLDPSTVVKLQELLADSKKCVSSTSYETGSGDLPDYFFALDASLDQSVAGTILHGNGKEVIPTCAPAENLLQTTANICKMKKEIRQLRKNQRNTSP